MDFFSYFLNFKQAMWDFTYFSYFFLATSLALRWNAYWIGDSTTLTFLEDFLEDFFLGSFGSLLDLRIDTISPPSFCSSLASSED